MTGDQLSIDDALEESRCRVCGCPDGEDYYSGSEHECPPGFLIPSRTTDPETSHVAAREVKVRAGTQRARLLYAFNDYHWNAAGVGLTDEAAMEYAEGVSAMSEFSKRCSELREGGFIEPTGETRAGSAGPQRIVSRITDKGRAWIEANR
jgi:hypothetical protein